MNDSALILPILTAAGFGIVYLFDRWTKRRGKE